MTTQPQGVTEPSQFNFNTNIVRIIVDDQGEPWFLANDICAVLGYANPRKAVADHCRQRGVTKRDTPTESGVQEMTYINEGNLYRLTIKSRKPESEPFENWVCDEVLPTIRKTGKYESPQYVLKALTTNPKAPRAKFALPGGLTLEQQDLVNDLIADRLATLPHDKQGKAIFNIRGALVSKWGFKGIKHGYKNIPAEQFTNVMNLIARLELDGDHYVTLPKEDMAQLIDDRVQEKLKSLPAPKPLEGEILPKPNTLTVDLNMPDGMRQFQFEFKTEGVQYGRWAMWQSDGVFSIRVMDNDEFLTSSANLPGRIKDSMGRAVRHEDLTAILDAASERLGSGGYVVAKKTDLKTAYQNSEKAFFETLAK